MRRKDRRGAVAATRVKRLRSDWDDGVDSQGEVLMVDLRGQLKKMRFRVSKQENLT